MTGRGGCAAVLALVAFGAPPGAAAQQRDVCRLVRADSYLATAPGTPDERHYFRGPVHFTCGTDVTLRADSAVGTPATGRHLLIGNVFYEDSVKTLTADRLTYLRPLDRLHATGDVELRDRRDGSILRGPELEHHGVRGDARGGPARAAADSRDGPPAMRLRPRDAPPPGAEPDSGAAAARGAPAAATRTIVRGGAYATIQPRDSASAAPSDALAADSAAAPLEVESERLEITGREWFHAVGDVRLRRGASRGFAREATYDREQGHLELDGEARIEDEAFDLLGERIDAFEAGARGELDRVHASGDAVLLGREMRLQAPDIRVFFVEGELHRLVAAGLADAVAAAESTEPASPADTSATRDAPARPALRPDEGREPAAPPGAAGPGGLRAPSATELAGRPRLDSPDLGLTADSLDVLAPAQRLERVTAVGDAYAERAADSLGITRDLPDFARRDWVRGDTIVGHFVMDTLPPDGVAPAAADPAADETGTGEEDRVRSVLERVVASGGGGHARSLYRMPADSAAGTATTDSAGAATPPMPRINYVIARRLVMSIRNGSIAAIEAEGGVRGTYSEPAAPAAPDTTGVATPPPGRVPETPPDTTGGER